MNAPSVKSRIIHTKDGNFCFTLQEWAEMKGMTNDERLRKLQSEFGDEVSREAVVYLSNKVTATILTEGI